MKNILLFTTLALLLIGCNNSAKKKFIKEYHYSASVKFGEPTAGELEHREEFEYNDDEKILKQSLYVENGGDAWYGAYIYEYDDKGEMTKIESYNSDGELDWGYKYEYDDGKKIKGKRYNSDGELELLFKYDYNSDGEMTKEENYDSDGELEGVSKFEYIDDEEMIKLYNSDGKLEGVVKYNGKGQRLKQENYNSDGEFELTYTCEYSDDGKVLKQKFYDSYGELQQVDKYEYPKFDNEDNWIEKVEYRGDEIVSIIKREITYW